jgi:hypothetical protein
MNKENLTTSTFNKNDLEKLKPFLPYNYMIVLGNKINNVIASRQIRLVLYGLQKDNHDVIPTLLKMVEAEKKKIEKIKSAIETI